VRGLGVWRGVGVGVACLGGCEVCWWWEGVGGFRRVRRLRGGLSMLPVAWWV